MGKAHNGHRYRQAVAVQRRKRLPCSICCRPIDYSLPANHADAYSLEHKVPVSLGGSLLDSRNHDSAHRRCNSAKGNRAAARIVNPEPATITTREW